MNMQKIFTYAALILLASCSVKKELPEWQKKYDNPKTIREMFSEPPMFYAPHTFWFWDDTIRDEHFAASMIDEMAKQRLNPGYAHPRGYLRLYQTGPFPELPKEQYLAQPWFNSFGNAVQKAKDSQLTLGYCDEYNWPSGQAAGKVLEQHPELEAKYLTWKRFNVFENETVQLDSSDFAVAGKLVDNEIDASSLKIINEGSRLNWKAPEGNWVVYAYRITPLPEKQRVKINYLDSRLMDAFIPLVHDQYAKHFGEEMGKTIPGVFVDNEGDYGWQMAWSDYFAQRYKEIKKQDIRLWLPLLTEKDKDGLFAKARYDWFDVVSEVYLECFFKPVVEWLKQHDMYYISNLWESSLQQQAKTVGDYMRITREVTMPGNDCLQMTSQNVHDFKETQSVAEFEDRPFMSEIMGVAEWGQTPQMMKMTINSITAFGVSHVVPHGINLNRRLETIPYPADWFTESPYWPYLHYWTDFARRAAFVTRQSKLMADVLLLNPQESVWALAEDCFSNEGSNKWDKRPVQANKLYSEAMKSMNINNVDFLIADSYYVENGLVEPKSSSAFFSIKNHKFQALVLPPASVISRAVSTKILEFAKNGGVVVLLGDLPGGSTEKGMKDDEIISQMNELRNGPNVIDLAGDKDQMDKLIRVLNTKITPQIRLENSGRLFTAHRKIENNDIYWMANNTDSVKNFTAWLRDGEGAAEIWNCENGKFKPVVFSKDNGYNKLDLTLQPYEGYWVAFNPRETIQKETKADQPFAKEISLDQNWALRFPGTDTLCKTTAKVLDTNSKVINEELLKPGFDDSGWKYYRNENHPRDRRDTSKPEKWKEYLHWRMQIPVGATSVVFPVGWVDKDIRLDGKKIHLAGTRLELPAGASLISFFISTENLKTVLTAPFRFASGGKENCALKSWYKYGLQQFTGYVDYETKINITKPETGISLDLGKVKYMAEVFVNGKSVGARLWPPYVFDLSGLLQKGENTIAVRVGNLMIEDIWMKEDLGKLRTWGWNENPDLERYDAGLFGPVKLRISE